jgi:hypothetical protein
MPGLKTNPKQKTTAKWESVGGEQILVVPAGLSHQAAIKGVTAELAEIITKNPMLGEEEVRIKLVFAVAIKEMEKQVAGKSRRAAETSEAAREKRPFDPEAKGMQLVEKAKTAEGGAWSGSELQQLFQLSPANLHRRRKEHRIIFWRDAHHAFFYPKWQFTGTGALQPGIEEVLDIFKSSDEWRVMRYFLTPRYQLDDKRPLDLLRADEAEKVLTHARTHAEEGSW